MPRDTQPKSSRRWWSQVCCNHTVGAFPTALNSDLSNQNGDNFPPNSGSCSTYEGLRISVAEVLPGTGGKAIFITPGFSLHVHFTPINQHLFVPSLRGNQEGPDMLSEHHSRCIIGSCLTPRISYTICRTQCKMRMQCLLFKN